MFQPALEVFEHLISSSPACCRSSLGTWNWTFGQPIDIGWNFRRLELRNARWATDHNWPNAAMQMTFRLKWCFVLHHVASILQLGGCLILNFEELKTRSLGSPSFFTFAFCLFSCTYIFLKNASSDWQWIWCFTMLLRRSEASSVAQVLCGSEG